MTIEIREVSPTSKDLPRVMKIAEAVGWGKFTGTPEEYHAAVVARGRGRIFAACRGAVVMGYVEVVARPSKAWELAADTVYIFAAAVDPRQAKSGVASELVGAVLQMLRGEGYARAVADVRWDNVASLNLSSRVGARVIGPSPEAVMRAAGGQAHLRVELSYAA
jgi:ribosomal protein S18 acetylase RimI-like enzyme